MRIGEAASASGVTVKAIRHYEDAGVLRTVARSGTYRDFTADDVERLKLVAHCRGLGFSVAEVKSIVDLVEASSPACPPPALMEEIVSRKLRDVRVELAELERSAENLEAARCYLLARKAQLTTDASA